MPDFYYDGKSAIPVSGDLTSEETGLIFESGDSTPKTFHFSYTQIQSLEKLGNEYRLELKNPNEDGSDLILTFESEDKAARIKKNRSRTFGDGPGGLISRFLQLPNLYQILIAGILAFGIVLLLFTKLDRLYIFVPESADKSLGNLIGERFEAGYSECKNRKLKYGVEKIYRTILPNKRKDRYEIRILRSDDINAFALPGGKIYILSGLIRESETPEEIAAILAHEISHIEQRHGIRQVIRLLGISIVIKLAIGLGFEDIGSLETITEIINTLTILRYSREFEEEADENAFETLKKSEVGVQGFIDFFEREETKIRSDKKNKNQKHSDEEGKKWDPEKILDWFSTHPDNQARIQKAKDFSKRIKTKTKGIQLQNWKKIRESCSEST
ncbi:M48 family metallopeptidase [Leptospira sp. 201903070]|uniref:M48 family metallopeptidase n=1 Tax=Leptospira ainlahdjerensis TaxID=2810033 RepID=A0ABS2U9I4_9LEPT|nr:M48 family metallopeptidase [Leptospira ainlahdjerensis]MBM9577021.1 M48 family metallopeptidase [Leptospira ainlahdjerensis]